MNFESGQKVQVKPGTFHNPRFWERTLHATFISYMPGREYAILLVKPTYDDRYNIRVKVEDLIDDNN